MSVVHATLPGSATGKYLRDDGSWQTVSGAPGSTDHGDLTGLADDDHSQYHNNTRGDARYSQLGHAHAASDVSSGTLATARLGSGTANSGTFLRGDQTWAAPPGGGEAFPVGAVFISVVSTNPATLLGYGTWAGFGAGRVLVGLDSGDTDFDTVEETGGSKTVASTGSNSAPTFTGSALATHQHAAVSAGTPAGTNAAESTHTHEAGAISWPAGVPTNANEAAHTHTYNTVIAHTHTLATGTGATGNFSQVIGTVDTSSGGTGGTPTQTALGTLSGSTGSASGTTSAGAAHTHTVSWPAGVPTSAATAAGSSHNHAFTGSALATHQHDAITAGTPAGTVSAPTFTGNATSVVQPYIVCYFWKRTA